MFIDEIDIDIKNIVFINVIEQTSFGHVLVKQIETNSFNEKDSYSSSSHYCNGS
jgi:hypothetical protein